jgi:uncharacterized membrane protein
MKRWHGFERAAFAAFLFWSAAGLIFTWGKISPETVAGWPVAAWLRAFIDLCVRTGDPLLIVLAFANTHLHAARQWGPAPARRWALIVCLCALAVETLGAATGFPFGSYHYTHRFGPMLGVVPLTIPLAWHVVVTNAIFIVRALAREQSRLVQAAGTGLVCTAYDFILEPFATGSARQYWIWQGGAVPVQNYLAWLIVSGLLAWGFAPALVTRDPRDPRPAVILGVTLLIFVAGR